jgi:hypothetical protein
VIKRHQNLDESTEKLDKSTEESDETNEITERKAFVVYISKEQIKDIFRDENTKVISIT